MRITRYSPPSSRFHEHTAPNCQWPFINANIRAKNMSTVYGKQYNYQESTHQ